MAADPDLVALFAHGWAITRDVPLPVSRLGGHYIEVGQPDQKARYIFPDLDVDRLRALSETIREPWIYLKVCADPAEVRAVLPPEWALRESPTFLMTTRLDADAPVLPADTNVTIHGAGAVHEALVQRHGVTLARGRIALLGETVLFDQIATEEPYRRQGLGRALMQSLSRAALDLGAREGLLSATDMGRMLYQNLGWQVHSPYTSAVIPG